MKTTIVTLNGPEFADKGVVSAGLAEMAVLSTFSHGFRTITLIVTWTSAVAAAKTFVKASAD